MVSSILVLVLIFELCLSEGKEITEDKCKTYQCVQGGIIRGDTSRKALAIVFTGGDYADGGRHIQNALESKQVKSSFFFTGDFYRNPEFQSLIQGLKKDGHFLGAHSDKHLLYCDWSKRDSLLVTKEEFTRDLSANYDEMARFGIFPEAAHYFMPPYEWYNDSISQWTNAAGFQLINFTPGTLSNADYTTPAMPNYRSSEEIFNSIVKYEADTPKGLSGFILLIHIGTAPERTDKFYLRLEELIVWIKGKGYELKRIDELLKLGR